MSCRIGANTELEQGAVGGQPSRSFEETNPFPEQGKHRMHNPCLGFSLYNIYFMFMIVHLRVGVLWNLVALGTPLQEYLVYPYERIVNDSMLCLVCRLSVEDEWSKAARDRALSIDGGPMWFMSSDRFVV